MHPTYLPHPDDPEPRWSTPPPRPERTVVHLPRHTRTPTWNEPGTTRRAIWSLLRTLTETLNGRRELAQLRGTMTAPVYEAMLTRVRASHTTRHRLTTLHTCRTTPTAIELCATLHTWPPTNPHHWRAITLAGRIENTNGTWRLVALRPLLPGPPGHGLAR